MSRTPAMSLSESLAGRLPDVPRWVEARALLRSGECEVLGLREEPELSFVVLDPEPLGGAIAVGAPADDAIRAAAERSSGGGSLMARLDQAERIARLLPAWTATRAILHLPGERLRLPRAAAGQVRFLDAGELAGLYLPGELGEELAVCPVDGSQIAATIVDGRPVSFCYAGAVTETLWDVSIDTLPEHRRRGYASLCAAYLIRHMRARGKQPVWGSDVANPGSWRLASKLGFVPVDEMALFEPMESEG